MVGGRAAWRITAGAELLLLQLSTALFVLPSPELPAIFDNEDALFNDYVVEEEPGDEESDLRLTPETLYDGESLFEADDRLQDSESLLVANERLHDSESVLVAERITNVAEEGGLRFVIGRPWRLQAKLSQCAFGGQRWNSYKAFHAEGRRAIQAGKKRRMVIWRCMTGDTCGGNGDQIRGLLSTFYWAVQNRHLFFVQWERQNYSIPKLLRPSHIDWQMPGKFSCSGEERLSLMTSSRDRFDGKLSAATRQSTCIYVRSNLAPTKARAARAGLPYRAGCAFHFLFQPSPVLINTMAKRQMPMTTVGAYVAIHLRFGDRQMAPPGERLSSAASTRIDTDHGRVLEAALACTRKMDSDRRLPVVVYADDLHVKQMAADRSWVRRHAAGMTVDSSRNEGGKLFKPSHTDLLRQPDAARGVIDAWADQFGLASAAEAVVTYSGFSRLALEIGMLPPEAIRYFGFPTNSGNNYICKFSNVNIGSWPIDQ